MTTPRWALCLTATGIAGTAVFVLGASGSARADTDSRYDLSAQGDSMVFVVNNPSIPASPTNESGSLTTHAELNSNGNSKAFAGAPYYGKTVQTLPGTINGVPGGFGFGQLQFPFTTLPGYVETRYPSKADAADDGQYYRIAAHSGETSSSASGDDGSPVSIPAPNRQQESKASVTAGADGKTVSNAYGSAAGFVSGPLEIGNSTAQALITDPGKGAKPHIESKTFGRFSVNGQQFGFDQAGFRYLGQQMSQHDALQQANTALKNAGMQLDIAPVEQTTDGNGAVEYVISGLKLTTYQSPTDQDPNQTITYILGRAMISSVNVPLGASISAGIAKGVHLGANPGVASGDTKVVAPDATGGSDVAPAPLSGAVGSTEGASTDLSKVTAPAATPAAAAEPLSRTLGFVPVVATRGEHTDWLYGMLALGGIAVLAVQQGFQRFVR